MILDTFFAQNNTLVNTNGSYCFLINGPEHVWVKVPLADHKNKLKCGIYLELYTTLSDQPEYNAPNHVIHTP